MIAELGNVDENDMREAFNLGIGLCVICDKDHANTIISTIHSLNEKAYLIGRIE
jgi:phosphoribosylformylglycinamidine cyclo-ligase